MTYDLKERGFSARGATVHAACFHCGEPCPGDAFRHGEKAFCCQGCRVVHDLLQENGLGQFYELSATPGVRNREAAGRDRWAYLDDPELQNQLLDFTDGQTARITFHLPAIHCVACVWLLENLYRLNPAVVWSRVNFTRRDASVRFTVGKLKLSELAGLLALIGYEPSLTLGELDKGPGHPGRRRQWLQTGVAGFAFGNIMLFSLPAYFGLDSFSGPAFKALFGYLSLGLALPVLAFSASDYWRSAWLSWKQRVFTLDVPIAAGLAALYGWSAAEIISGRGAGYLDSMSGLVFLLLCGRAFQQKTHERLAFDRDYKSFFPLCVTRKLADGTEETAPLSRLGVGDCVVVRNGELIPADAVLRAGNALVDYSFVTGESEPVARTVGARLYAGGRQSGAAIELKITKPVSQSYLTSLWDHETFQKQRDDRLNTLTNRYSRRFTLIVFAIALGALAFWILAGQPARALKAFTSVLIVACPCALALAAPFTLGSAQRFLGRAGVFLKNALVVERLARTDAIVFDKTGTLTAAPTAAAAAFHGAPLSDEEESCVASLARQSTHPYARRIQRSCANVGRTVDAFAELAGRGIEGRVHGRQIRLGSRAWLDACGVKVPAQADSSGSIVHLAIEGEWRGAFVLANAVRDDIGRLLQSFFGRYETALLSGDNDSEQGRFRKLFGDRAVMRFNQSPLDKLEFVRALQHSGRTVIMVGDGLNDAGALRQSDVGVAVVETVGAFSPGSDVILDAANVPRLANILAFARTATAIVRAGFVVSAAYNLIGVSIAAAGILSPLVCAVLMPLSSFTVVALACGLTAWSARRWLKPMAPRSEIARTAIAAMATLPVAEGAL
jgi:Cu+-exporting ATPase